MASLSSPIAQGSLPASRNILLVEDDHGLRNGLRRLLSRAGFQVFTACDGDEAVEAYAHHGGPFDLLLTDVVMPGMTGPELVQRLESTVGPEFRVLFMSGYTGRELSERGIDSVRQRLVRKPFSGDSLVAAVRGLLR